MPHKRLVLLAALGTAIATGASPAVAATLRVNTPFDFIVPGPGQCSLRDAVQAIDSPGTANGHCAPAAFGANTIIIGRGTYKLLAPNGELKVAPQVSSLRIIGAGEGETVIDATGLGDRFLDVPAGPSVEISDLTVTGARAADGATGKPGNASTGGTAGGAGANGGAILNAGTLTLTDVAVMNSEAGTGGAGGTGDWPFGGTDQNGGAGGSGGEGGAIFNTGDLTLQGVTLAGNMAGDGGAGGPGGFGSGLESNGPFPGGSGGAGGSGGDGGGVASEAGKVEIDASTIRGNSAGAGAAGAVGGAGTSFSSAVAGGPGGDGGNGSWGGGVWSGGGTLRITNSTIVSNGAGAGGAGGVGAPQSQTAAPGLGGAGGNGGGGGGVGVGTGTSTELLSATVVGNAVGDAGAGGAAGQGTPTEASGADGTPATGGGVGSEAPDALALQNSILALNRGGNCRNGSVVDAGHNLSFGDMSCPSSFGSGDPNLGPLQDNGGPTETIGLGAGSAALDQIAPTGAGCPATDQRGVPRPSGQACDIGAYEVALPVVSAGSIRATASNAVSVSASVTANAGDAKVWIEYGRGKAYGRRSGVSTTSGVAPATVSIRLTGLNLGATYHYRIVIASTDGTTNSGDLTLAVPLLTSLRVVPDAFPEAGTPSAGAVLSYTESRTAITTFAIQRNEGRSWVTMGQFRHRDVAGRNRVRWDGRLGTRKLGPGRYRMLATPSSGPASGATVAVRFVITS